MVKTVNWNSGTDPDNLELNLASVGELDGQLLRSISNLRYCFLVAMGEAIQVATQSAPRQSANRAAVAATGMGVVGEIKRSSAWSSIRACRNDYTRPDCAPCRFDVPRCGMAGESTLGHSLAIVITALLY